MLYQLFGVGALAHRGLPPVRGFVREVLLAFPAPHYSARQGCPGHCGTLFYRADFVQINVLPLENTEARATMVELWVITSKLVPLPEAVCQHHLLPTFKGVCLVRIDGH